MGTKRDQLNSIDDFKSNVGRLGGFAVNNLFRTTVYFPADFFGYNKGFRRKAMQFMCRSATIPTSNITPLDVPFRGMNYKIPGDRVYEPITLTFMNDNKQTMRNHFVDWHQYIRAKDNNYMMNRDENNVHAFGDIKVEVMGRTDTSRSDFNIVTAVYYFNEAWPTMISAMELDYGSNDAIQEFTVQFEYQNYVLRGNKRLDDDHFRY